MAILRKGIRDFTVFYYLSWKAFNSEKKKTPLFETHTQLYNQFIAIDILFRLKKETIYGAAKYLGVELFRRIENTDVEDRTR